MRRRHFIYGSAASLLAVAALDWRRLPVLAAPLSQDDYVFFDPRFEKARRIAASWTATIETVAVHGDITPWSDELVRAPRERPIRLRGVTTESFRFCAATLVGEHASLDLQTTRVDRDLVVWTISATPKHGTERSHG